MGYTNASGWVMILFYTKMSFFDNFVKKTWQQLEFLEKIFGFPYLFLKLDPPPQGKNALVFIF